MVARGEYVSHQAVPVAFDRATHHLQFGCHARICYVDIAERGQPCNLGRGI
jgi:hypothetical protein